MRSLVFAVVRATVRGLGRFNAGRAILDEVLECLRRNSMNTSGIAEGGLLRFATPNRLTRWRTETFNSKEPETLEWIQGFGPTDVLWDVGANVGLYTCYAAARGHRVVAAEPSPFNLELIARNLILNGIVDHVTVVPIALTDRSGTGPLQFSDTRNGGALSTFREGYGSSGDTFDAQFDFPTVGISLAEAVDKFGLPKPDHLKLDVDGIEHLILAGAGEYLRAVKSVLVELDDRFEDQKRSCRRLLTDAGLRCSFKAQPPEGVVGISNQIWTRAHGA